MLFIPETVCTKLCLLIRPVEFWILQVLDLEMALTSNCMSQTTHQHKDLQLSEQVMVLIKSGHNAVTLQRS